MLFPYCGPILAFSMKQHADANQFSRTMLGLQDIDSIKINQKVIYLYLSLLI